MSQNNVNYADNPTGPQLMDNYLAKSQENNLTTNSGVQRPTYAKAGTFWINSSANPWILYFYNGSKDVAIGTIGTGSSGTFSVEGVDLSNYVTTNTQQNITAAKTFTKQVTKTNASASTDTIFVNKNTSITKGTAPSANVESRWRLTDSSTGDSNSAFIGGVTFGYATNMRTSALLQVGKPEAGSTSTATLGIYYPATGDPYTSAPTPATSDNSTKIATTAHVKAQGYATNSTISSSPYLVLYGTSTSAADATAKIVEISSSYAAIPTISAGQLLIVKPTITSTVADSTITVQKSSTTLLAAKTMKYNNANITTSTDSIVWSANVCSIFVYDGSYWQFLGHGLDNNTTYSTMSVAEGIAGTATNNRVMRADYLAQILEGKGYLSASNLVTADAIVSYSLGTNGYIKFSNNCIIQWGTTTSAAAGTAITLPTPFATTNYSVTITSIGDAGVYQRLVSANTAKTTTKFTTYAGGGAASDNFSWQAIGK